MKKAPFKGAFFIPILKYLTKVYGMAVYKKLIRLLKLHLQPGLYLGLL
jgi:hypothetical protein